MKFRQYLSLSIVSITVGVLVFLGDIKSVRGELVFEDELKPEHLQDVNATRSVERPTEAALKSNDVGSSNQQAGGYSSVTENNTSARENERKEISKSEMLRRQRLREELRNEDIVAQKLEELRLKDEMKRTEELMKASISSVSAVEKQPQDVSSQNTAIVEQKVGSAATPAATQSVAPVIDNSTANVTTVQIKPEEKQDTIGRVSVTPRAGLTNLSSTFYEVESRYTVGFGLSVDLNDYLGFQGGYSFSQYNLGSGGSLYNPYTYNLQQLEMNDNVIDVGLRAYFLSPQSRVRPYIGVGGAYRKGYINYDDRTLEFLKRYNVYDTQDVQLSAFAGMLETGLEVKITKMISLTGMFRYFNILSYRQSNPVNPYAFINPNGLAGGYNSGLVGGYNSGLAGGYGYGGGPSPYSAFGYNNDSRTQVGNNLAQSNFYQIMGGLSISF